MIGRSVVTVAECRVGNGEWHLERVSDFAVDIDNETRIVEKIELHSGILEKGMDRKGP